MPATPESTIHADAAGLRIAIVVSRYNAWITDALLQGALDEYGRLGGDPGLITVTRVPGAFELPVAASTAAASPACNGVVALGCLIRGETSHDRVIADAVARGLMRVSVEARIPVGFGVLTVDDASQAEARAGGEMGNKGAEAMRAVVETARALRVLRDAPAGAQTA